MSTASQASSLRTKAWLWAKRGLVGLVVFAIAAPFAWWCVCAYAGTPAQLLAERWHHGRVVLARDGQPLYVEPSPHGLRGLPRPLAELGTPIAIATRVAEDRRFFTHGGVDSFALARAITQNLRAGRVVSGGSTITAQLVDMLHSQGSPRRPSAWGKVIEAAQAQNLEAELGKAAILQAYLNRLPYGHGISGPELAARTYFAKHASELSWAEAAYLAIIPRAPSAFDPYRHPQRVVARQRVLLARLHAHGEIDAAQLDEALQQDVTVERRAPPFWAPHLALGLLANDHTDEPRVHTTVDLAVQKDVAGALAARHTRLRRAGASHAAVLVLDNESGEILAWVGNAAWTTEAGSQVDMVTAHRQAGSILKPFAYALAFEAGATPSTVLADVPTTFNDGPEGYTPRNIDRGYLGPLAAAEALTLSRNVPAVEIASTLREGALLKFLRDAGFEGLRHDAKHYGPALVLGAAEVSLLELVEGYACLARGGSCIGPRVRTDQGVHTRDLLSPATSALVTEALASPSWKVRFLEVGQVPLTFSTPTATKTGTSQNYVDTWTVAYNRRFTVAAWVGNADGHPTRGLTGSVAAGRVVKDVMNGLTERFGAAQHDPWDHKALVRAKVCPLSGARPSEVCPDAVERSFAQGQVPAHECRMHRRGAVRSRQFVCDPAGPHSSVVLPQTYASWTIPSRHRAGPIPWRHLAEVRACE